MLPSIVHYYSKKLQENNYSSGKNSFKLLCGNINKNCDVHVAINRACYHSKKLQENNDSSGFLRSFYLVSLMFGYLWNSFSAA